EDGIRDFHVTGVQTCALPISTYAELHAWSVERSDEFWKSIWDYFKIIGERGERIVVNPDQIPGAQWFPDAQLNFAENLLRYNDDHVALIFRGENGARDQHTYAELRSEVAALAAAMKRHGVQPGDRVAAMVPNCVEDVI